jgi:hypothetical protein
MSQERLVEICGSPCPQAPDLYPCLLSPGHGGEWHRNLSSSWPVVFDGLESIKALPEADAHAHGDAA